MKIYKNSKFNILFTCLFIGVNLIVPINFIFAQSYTVITDIQSEKVENDVYKITWKTNTNSGGKVVYGEDKDNLSSFIIDSNRPSKFHDISIGNLEEETIYYYKVQAYNNYGVVNSFIYSFETEKFNDGISPDISNLETPYVTGTAAFVIWETDEDSSSWVDFGVNGNYTNRAGGRNLVKEHQIILRNLSKNTKYYIRAYSFDEDGNRSSYISKTFTTTSSNAHAEDLEISNLRPSGQEDPNIFGNAILVQFKTNHYAKGDVRIGGLSRVLEYGLYHEAYFSGLSLNTEYNISINMDDIFGKKTDAKILGLKTFNVPPIEIECGIDTSGITGYFGQYYNLSKSTPNLYDIGSFGKGRGTGWYDEKYLSFSRVDYNLNFAGYNFLPIPNEGLEGDPFYFSVYWRAIIEAPKDGEYEYKISVDNSGWVYFDNTLTTDLGNHLPLQTESKKIRLSEGRHFLEIYFAERSPGGSYFNFELDKRIKVNPWLEDCSAPSSRDIKVIQEDFNEFGNNEGVIVKGVDFSLYTPASKLIKASDSPDIYAVVNNQRHYISSPASFDKYGYNWGDIETISRDELEKYPRARLIKSAESDTIYFLYQRPENQWLKTNMPSPTVFVSYPDNFWGNVITVTQLDVDSYPNVRFIKTKDSSDIYFIESGIKHYVSEEVFISKKFSIIEIAEVNQTHLDSFQLGNPLN